MKVLIFLLLSTAILIQKGGKLPICTIQTVKVAFAPVSFEQITVDGPDQNVILTRFLHNKVGIYASETAICYFNALDPTFIFQSTGILGLISFTYFAYKISVNRNWLVITVFLLSPFLPFFGASTAVLSVIYKIFAIIGLAFMLKLK